MKVLVFFVIRDRHCDLVTAEKDRALAYVEMFNRHKKHGTPGAEIKEKEVLID